MITKCSPYIVCLATTLEHGAPGFHTAHWIDVKEGKWKLRSEVVGFKLVSGDHSGWNLGRYIVGLCERVGICTQDLSRLIPAVSISYTYYLIFI